MVSGVDEVRTRFRQVFFFVQFLFLERCFPFRFEMPSRQDWFPLLRDGRGGKSVFTVVLNAIVSRTCWVGMAECWVNECFLDATDPVDRGNGTQFLCLTKYQASTGFQGLGIEGNWKDRID